MARNIAASVRQKLFKDLPESYDASSVKREVRERVWTGDSFTGPSTTI